ncbi:MAG: ATP-dependent sacrificial sulfur transferase LarE [Tissierellia bacterium]|nr:ATP-dependent sacrificial sulfur transferase LarE [Tissierellia bacterium]
MEKRLRKILSEYGKLAIGYSGGVDSAYLMDVGTETLGKDNILGVFFFSEFQTPEEKEDALALGLERNWNIEVIEDSVIEGLIQENPPNRCYYCKKKIFQRIYDKSLELGFTTVADGTNGSDIFEDRPGRVALKELGVVSPLLEVGMTKNDIRHFAKLRNLKPWNRPSNSCLATRIPSNQEINREDLFRIYQGEKFLKSLGFQLFRLRNHGELARIMFSKNDWKLFLAMDKKEIKDGLSKFGFTFITVDINEYGE